MRINIVDAIDQYWGTSANSVRAQIAQAAKTGEALDIVISSPGGSVFEGLQIYHEIKSYIGEKTVTVVGIAASIASVVAMAGDRIRMAKGSMMMIHNPWTYAAGNGDELRETADVLDMLAESLNGIYAQKTGMDAKQISKLMDAETYMTASDAVAKKFATEEVDTISTPKAMAFASMNIQELKKYFQNGKHEKESYSTEEKIAILKLLNKKTSREEDMYTIEDIKNKAPQVFAQILEEGKASIDVESIKASAKTEAMKDAEASIAKASSDAVASERKRISDVQALCIPGLESVVAKCIEDGDSVEQASVKILASVKNASKAVLDQLQSAEEVNGKVAASAAKSEAEEKDPVVEALSELKEKNYIK